MQFLRYVLVGGFNTVFGYGLFALLNWLFKGLGPYSYMYAAVLANPIAITLNFLGYKWFVFRTHGNYMAEWFRCLGVCGSSMLIGLVGLPIFGSYIAQPLGTPCAFPIYRSSHNDGSHRDFQLPRSQKYIVSPEARPRRFGIRF
jgi:putative flippase GtrA